MSWLNTLDKDQLLKLHQESQCCLIAAGLSGEIYWASEQFCQWSGYTETELKKLGWIAISKQDESLEADKLSAEEMRLGTRTFYTVQKAYIKKTGTPQWGILSVQRVPDIGDLKFAWCHWTPIEGASDTAFALAMDCQSKLEVRIKDMAETIKVLTNQTEEERLVHSFGRVMLKYPRVFLMVFVVLGGSTGGKFIIDICERLGLIQPTKTEIVVPKGASMPDLQNTEGLALRRVADEQASVTKQFEWRSADGGVFSWTSNGEANHVGARAGTTTQMRSADSGFQSGDHESAGGESAGATNWRGAGDVPGVHDSGSDARNF